MKMRLLKPLPIGVIMGAMAMAAPSSAQDVNATGQDQPKPAPTSLEEKADDPKAGISASAGLSTKYLFRGFTVLENPSG